MTSKLLLILGLLLASLSSSKLGATEEPNRGAFSFRFGMDSGTQYYFRGLLRENQGVMLQPWYEIGTPLYEDHALSVEFSLGTWNSFHSGPTGEGGQQPSPQPWFESDIYGALTASIDRFELNTSYVFYSSPNNSFTVVRELNFGVSFDDSDYWISERFGGLQPYVGLAWEIGGAADRMDEGSYLELGIEPSIQLPDESVLSLPVTVGLSLNEYFEDATGDDERFGFARAGIAFSAPFLFIPRDYGAWGGNIGVFALWLGDHAADINNGESFEIVATGGISVAY